MRTGGSGLVALMLLACNSTGVGNPAPASLQLSITRDDEPTALVGGAGEGGSAGDLGGDGGGTVVSGGGSPMSDGGATTGGGATTDGGAMTGAGESGASTGGSGGAPSSDAALPRAAIEDALLLIGEVHFMPCEIGQSVVVAAGPFMVDLVNGRTSPSIPAVAVPPGGFCGLDAPLVPAKAPSRLVGRSVYFGGTRADGTPFQFYANVQATLRVRARPGAAWGTDSTLGGSVFWALRPRQWLEPGELDALEASNDGSGVSIDVERHPALLRAIRSRLAGRSTLYADVNDDHAFDLADRESPLGDGIPDAD